MFDVNDLVYTSIETIMGFKGNDWKFTLDELQSASIANTQEKTPIVGKMGRKLSNIKKNKAVTITGANGVLSGGLLETEVGSNAVTGGNSKIRVPDFLTVSVANTITTAVTTHTAVGTAGAEIKKVYVKNSDGTIEKTLTQNTSLVEGKFTYTVSTKTITFYTGDVSDGDEIVVYYDRNIAATVLSNYSDKYSDKVTLFIDVLAEDKCHNVYHVQYYVPTADFSGNFNIDVGENQTVQNFEAESLASNCGGSTKYWDMIIFGVNPADVAV
jgi:hypothetical protein